MKHQVTLVLCQKSMVLVNIIIFIDGVKCENRCMSLKVVLLRPLYTSEYVSVFIHSAFLMLILQ